MEGTEPRAPATLPRCEPFSPTSFGSSEAAKLKVRLARLRLKADEKEKVRKADIVILGDLRGPCPACGLSVLLVRKMGCPCGALLIKVHNWLTQRGNRSAEPFNS
ncbi:unnamed protein product [Lota lota]